MAELIERLRDIVPQPKRVATGPLIFAADHCFAIKGQGTVLTGTVLNGQVSVGDSVEIADLKVCAQAFKCFSRIRHTDIS